MQANLQWLDDPEVFRVNQLPAHSDHPYYHDTAEFKTGSRFIKRLNGAWRFNFAKTPAERPVDFINPISMQPTLIRFKFPVILN